MALSMTISIQGSQVAAIDNIPFTGGTNVQHAMEVAYNTMPGRGYNFSLRYFGPQLGYQVVVLDNISQQGGSDPDAFLFWELLINGVISRDGVDGTFPADGDQIGWNYTGYVRERHAGTRYEEIRAAG